MKAQEIVANLAPVELERLRLIFLYLAAHAGELRLASDARLLDGSDWKEFFHELGDALAEAAVPPQVFDRMNLRPRDPTCADCTHVHEGKTECGHYLGEEKFCRCESKVTA